MIKVIYFRYRGSGESLSGHAGVQVVDHVGQEIAYITWSTVGSIPERRWKALKLRWLASLRDFQAGYGVTVDSLEEDRRNYGEDPLVVELPALTKNQAGIDEEALLRWWWSFSQDLGNTYWLGRRADHDRLDHGVTYDLLSKNCTTISAMALLAGGMHHYASMGTGTGSVGSLTPQKLRSATFRALWRPKMLYDCALRAKAKIDLINADAKKLSTVLEREERSAQKRARFFNPSSHGMMLNGLWTVEAWKKASKGSSRLSHRYQSLINIDKALAAYHATSDETAQKVKLHELALAVHKQLAARPMSNRKPAVLALGAQIYERMTALGVDTVGVNKGHLALLERNTLQYREPAEQIMEDMQRTVEAATQTLDLVRTAVSEHADKLERHGGAALVNQAELYKSAILNYAEIMEDEYGIFNFSPNPEEALESLKELYEGFRRQLAEFFDTCTEIQKIVDLPEERQESTSRTRRRSSAFIGRHRSNSIIGQHRSRANSGPQVPPPGGTQDNDLVEISLDDSDSEGWEEIPI